MPRVRLKLSLAVRYRLLARSGGRCALCTVPLATFDLHHIEFHSLGGDDGPENLAVLCPVCHRNLAHALYASPQGRKYLRAAVQRWHITVSALHEAQQANRALRSVNLLTQQSVTTTLIVTGAYDLYLSRARFMRTNASDFDTLALHSRLDLLAAVGTMAYYTRAGLEEIALQLRAAVSSLDTSRELSESRNSALLTLSRIAMVNGDHSTEQRLLDSFTVEGATTFQLLDHTFRTASSRRYRGLSLETPANLDAQDSDLEEGVYRAKVASTLGELGREAATLGDVDTADELLKQTFAYHRQAVHRRGMAMTALRLASIYIESRDDQNALVWFRIAQHCGTVGVLPEFTQSDIEVLILGVFKSDFLQSRQALEAARRRVALEMSELDRLDATQQA